MGVMPLAYGNLLTMVFMYMVCVQIQVTETLEWPGQ